MARHTNEQVAHLFAHRQAGDSNNLHSDGTTLTSYSTPIAQWVDGICFVSSNGMTQTTASKHLSPLHGALHGMPTFYTPAPDTYDRTFPSVGRCIEAAAEELIETFKTLCRSRVNLEYRIENYTARRQKILDTAERFSVDVPEIPEATGDLKEKAKALAAEDRKRRQEEQRRREEQERAQRIIDQGALDLWLQQGRGHFPASFRERGNDRITIKDPAAATVENREKITQSLTAKVVTSQGAAAPLEHVVKALKFYDSRKITAAFSDAHLGGGTHYQEYHTNGHKIHLGAFVLDEIDEQGNVRAGCHRFTAEEIARFRKQWNL